MSIKQWLYNNPSVSEKLILLDCLVGILQIDNPHARIFLGEAWMMRLKISDIKIVYRLLKPITNNSIDNENNSTREKAIVKVINDGIDSYGQKEINMLKIMKGMKNE